MTLALAGEGGGECQMPPAHWHRALELASWSPSATSRVPRRAREEKALLPPFYGWG